VSGNYLNDGNWGDFLQSIYSRHCFNGFDLDRFFDKSAHKETKNECESDYNYEVCDFYEAFQTGYVEMKSSRFELFKQARTFGILACCLA